jgi:hypothetical protein
VGSIHVSDLVTGRCLARLGATARQGATAAATAMDGQQASWLGEDEERQEQAKQHAPLAGGH